MPSVIRLPSFDWEKLIADPNTRHALQDFAAQVNTKLGDLQDQIDDIEAEDPGVPPHNLLQSDVHLDTITDDPSPGSLIVGEPIDALDLSLFWIRGLPVDFLNTERVTSGVAYWRAGLPFDAVSSLTDGDIKWVELLIGLDTYVLTSRGSRVEWAAVSGLVVRPAASVYLTADAVIPSETLTILTFGTAEFDSGPFWSAGDPTKLTVPAEQGGLYYVLGQVAWALASLGALRVVLLKNGASIGVEEHGETVTEGTPRHQAARLVSLSVGDYVQLAVYWDYSDVAGRTVTQGVDDTFLQLLRVN